MFRKSKQAAYTLRTLSKGLQALEAVAGSAGALTVRELSARLGESPTVVFRVLKTLEARGYVEQDPATRRYRLSFGVLELASPFLVPTGLPAVARPYMEALRDETGESVCLHGRVGWTQVALQVLSSPQPVRHAHAVGSAAPLHAGAAGKAILAFLPETDVARFVRATRLPALTRATLTDPARLATELARVRRHGYATSTGERVEGASAVAAPIVGGAGQVDAALSVLMPSSRASAVRLRRYAQLLRQAVDRITLQLRLGDGDERTATPRVRGRSLRGAPR
jgi:DNA-binding IclR family transcriptional regulator